MISSINSYVLLLFLPSLVFGDLDIGLIAYFPSSCPSNWVPYDPAAGRFILSAGTNPITGVSYPLNSTGGADQVILTTDQLPSHDHSNGGFNGLFKSGTDASTMTAYDIVYSPDIMNIGRLTSVGQGLPHNNIPPYLSLVVCKQTGNSYVVAQDQSLLQTEWNQNTTTASNDLSQNILSYQSMNNQIITAQQNSINELNLLINTNNETANTLIEDLQNQTSNVLNGVGDQTGIIDSQIQDLQTMDTYLNNRVVDLYDKLNQMFTLLNQSFLNISAADNITLPNQNLTNLKETFEYKIKNLDAEMRMYKILVMLSFALGVFIVLGWIFIIRKEIYKFDFVMINVKEPIDTEGSNNILSLESPNMAFKGKIKS